MRRLRLGLVINPLAGKGGSLAQKGSDELSFSLCASESVLALHALARSDIFFYGLGTIMQAIQWVAPAGLMGGVLLEKWCIPFQATAFIPSIAPSAVDTQAVVAEFITSKVDLIIFAGGDGTAADVARTVAELNPQQLVLGIPAGVKIQSAVFAINPTAASALVLSLYRGELMNVQTAEVRDLNEIALKQGRVTSKFCGQLLVPFDDRFVQTIKLGGIVAEELVIADIASYISELVPNDAIIVFGPGKTMADIQHALGLSSTLLGFDVFSRDQCLALDANEDELSRLLKDNKEPWIFLTVIGGQGHIIGRGNQQLSSAILQRVGRNAIHPVATREKLASVKGCRLLIDSGDVELDNQWQGLIPVITNYKEQLLCELVATPN